MTVELNYSAVRAVISVADDGPGIPVDEHQHVFRRFYRLERVAALQEMGWGSASSPLLLVFTRPISNYLTTRLVWKSSFSFLAERSQRKRKAAWKGRAHKPNRSK